MIPPNMVVIILKLSILQYTSSLKKVYSAKKYLRIVFKKIVLIIIEDS